MEVLSRFKLQETIDCDPSLESCEVSYAEADERPNSLDLFNLIWTVTALELAGPYLTTFLTLRLFPKAAIGFSVLIFLLPMALIYLYWLPILLSLLYFVFGNNIFIFNWVDSTLVFIIQYVMSMLTPTAFIFSIAFQLIYWYYNPDERGFATLNIVLNLLEAYALWTATMRLSVGAIRYLSPTWDMVEPGEYLWPAILYWLRIKKHSGGSSVNNRSEESLGGDVIAWAL